MSTNDPRDLLSQLAGHMKPEGVASPYASLDARKPAHETEEDSDERLNQLLERINRATAREDGSPIEPVVSRSSPSSAVHAAKTPTAGVGPEALTGPPSGSNSFVPTEPESFREADLTDSEVESLILKYLLARGDASGRDITDQVKLPFVLIDQLLRNMKFDRLLGHRGSAPMNDYVYELSDMGRERARRLASHCTYFGSAPVCLKDYTKSVKAQTIRKQQPSTEDLLRAFGDLILSDAMLKRLGPAVNSGRGLFLYGAPGNGKTSIAERVTAAFGTEIWIPRAIAVDGEIIRVFDPTNHEELPLEGPEGILEKRKIDRRWVRIKRPTIIAAGELTMDMLEVTLNKSTGISEAPLQLKSNCGTLVIDDFGRQRCSIDTLLNRWILPLEKRYDFLNLPNGKKIEVPFDQLIVFSTNLEPRDLVDEAFLRRIPYKIEVGDPSEEEFRRLLHLLAEKFGFRKSDDAIDYLIEVHYRKASRPMRYCHPRDLLMQVKSFCAFHKCELELRPDLLDMAIENYFSIM